MVMDTRLPLMAKAPDPLGSYSRGISAADLFNRTKQEQGKQNFLKQYGEALFSGDQNALSAYAAHDLQGAKQIQGQQQAEAARRAAAGRAAGRARAQEAQGRLQGGLDASSVIYGQAMELPEGEREAFFNEKMIEVVGPDFLKETGITVDTFPSRAAMFSAEQKLNYTPYEAPKGDYKVVGSELVDLGAEGGPAPVEGIGGATFRPTTQEEVTQYGQPGQIDDETGRFYPIKLPDGMTIKVSPEGSIEVVQGAGVGPGATPIERDKPAKGWERVPDPDVPGETMLRPEKGGPVWNDTVDLSQQQRLNLENFTKANDIVIEDATRALKLVEGGNFPTTGMAGLLAAAPGTPQRALANLLETIKAGVGLDTIVALKKAGGTLGAVSQSEMGLVTAKEGSLDQLGTTEDLAYNLRRIIEGREQAAVSMESAFNEDFKQVGVTFGARPTEYSATDFETMTKADMDKITTVDVGIMTPDQINAYIAAGERLGME